MILPFSKKPRVLAFERRYDAAPDAVWNAWTQPDLLRQWWGPEHTKVTECSIELREGGRIYIVMEATEGMGKYAGTRWPLDGTFTVIEPPTRLVYQARSWTEGEEETATIEHVNELTLTNVDGATQLQLRIKINKVGPGAKMAAFGMKWGYKQQLENLAVRLAEQA